jgi:antitoxin ParD1/3/4
MSITVRPDHEQWIDQAIEAGSYQNPDEVIGRALEVLRSEDQWLEENKEAINEKIDRAFDQFDRGEFFTADGSRIDMEKRKAARLREHIG